MYRQLLFTLAPNVTQGIIILIFQVAFNMLMIFFVDARQLLNFSSCGKEEVCVAISHEEYNDT